MLLRGAALLFLLALVQLVLCAEDYYKVRLLSLELRVGELVLG